MRRLTDAQIADANLCKLAKSVQEWLEHWEFLIGPSAARELQEILDEA